MNSVSRTDGLHYGEEIAAAAARISGAIRSVDLSEPVPHLGRWKVRDVVAHLGGVHRWAARIVSTQSMDGPGFRKSKLTGAELCAWFDCGAAELVELLMSTPLDDPCPNFNPGSPSTVQFWARRQLHETTIHCWDVESAVGKTTPIEAPVAVDGVDEFLDVFVRTRGKQTLIGPLTLTAEEPKRSWRLRPSDKPGRVDVLAERAVDAVGDESHGEIAGPADALLLLLWGRRSLATSGLTVHGRRDVATSLRGA